jgi:hypothetical protein
MQIKLKNKTFMAIIDFVRWSPQGNKTIYAYIGKVLAADLLDTDKFQNHFLLTAASLGSQLLKTYDIGTDKNGKPATLTVDKIRDFFFDILHGKIEIKNIDGKFDISQITGKFN